MKLWFARLVLLGTLGAMGFWGWRFFFPSTEQIIRKELRQLAEAASIGPNEGPLTKLASIQKLSSFFAADAQITVEVPGRSPQTLSGRDQIRQAAGAARSMLNNLRVQFVDVIVQVGADKQSALAHLTATANLPGEKIPEVQELEASFKKTDHDWLISRVVTVKTLR